MNKCFKCGCEFEGEFCPQCGTKYEKEKTCPNCNSKVCGNVKYCNHCGYSFEHKAAETSRPKKDTVVRNPFPIWSILAKALPQVSMYAFSLFSLLLWAFFSAPFASMLGISLGDVYTTLNGQIDDYLKIAQTSLAFGIISLVYSAVTIVLSFIPKTNNITVGKFNLIKLLSVCGNVLYVPFFALGCATMSKSKEIGMDNGNFSGLVIAFSIVSAAISIGSLIADMLLRRNVPAYFEAINSNAQAKADREEHKRQMLAERRANAERILAEKGIYEPKKVEHPNKKLGAMMFANFKICPLVYLIAFGFVLACILYIYCVSGYIGGWILFMLIGSIALSVAALIALVCPVKIYSQNERKKIVRRFRSQMLFISFSLFLSTIEFLMGSFWLIQGTIHLLDIDGMLLIGGYTSLPLLIFNIYLWVKIQRIFNFSGKKDYAYTTVVDGQEVPLTIELFCQQRNEYKKYCKDLRYYNYNVRKVSVDKPSVDRPQYNTYIKKIKAIVTACISAAVILAIVIGVAVDSQNIFKESKVNQIHSGMTKDEVVKILGETEFASDYSWNYYSSNFVKLMREAEDLSKQMANAQDFEQVLKIQQQIDELQKKMQNSNYKYITVTFDIEGKVTDVKYNFNYNPSKNAETQSSLGIKINYNLFSA